MVERYFHVGIEEYLETQGMAKEKAAELERILQEMGVEIVGSYALLPLFSVKVCNDKIPDLEKLKESGYRVTEYNPKGLNIQQ